MSDYDNPYGMSEQEFEYRAMNPQDPMYMGDRYSPAYSPTDLNVTSAKRNQNNKSSKNNKNNKPKGTQQNVQEEPEVMKDIPEWLFLVICFVGLGLLLWLGIWLMIYFG